MHYLISILCDWYFMINEFAYLIRSINTSVIDKTSVFFSVTRRSRSDSVSESVSQSVSDSKNRVD